MALCVAELVGTTSSGGEGASQKQPQAKQEDAKQQCEDRHDRHVGRRRRDAGIAADPREIHEAGLWSHQLRVSRISLSAQYRRRTTDECTYYVPTSGNLTGCTGLERTKRRLKTEGPAEKQFDCRRLHHLADSTETTSGSQYSPLPRYCHRRTSPDVPPAPESPSRVQPR